MIGYITGKVVAKSDKHLTIATNSGVGYIVHLPLQSIGRSELDNEVTFFIETIVREDAISLYGFSNEEEKELFQHLIEVDKVGPKLGMQILSAAPCENIVSAITGADVKFFKSISGIGAKTAEKIIIDLKDKVKHLKSSLPAETEMLDEAASRHVQEAETGLAALGYNRFMIKNVLAKIENKSKKRAEELVREALRIINEKK